MDAVRDFYKVRFLKITMSSYRCPGRIYLGGIQKMRMKSFFAVSMLFLSIFAVVVLNACSATDDEIKIPNIDEALEISDSNLAGDFSLSKNNKEEEAFCLEDSLSSLDSSNGMNSISELSPASDREAENDASSIMQKYISVLQGESTFFSIVAEGNINFNQLNLAVTGDNNDIVDVSQFAVLDLDGDKTEELVLRLTVDGDDGHAFLILHYQDDVIYGYTRWRRGFRELKADGSFSFSSGAADTGWGTLQFDGKILTVIEKARSRSHYDEDNNFFIDYFVDGTSVTEGDYTSAMGTFGVKPDVTWFDFVSDNLKKY
ncbi:hypothetical protein [Bacteroides acidifaciens]|uniref:hypothetical protein n=1 Tax=Bacteroides acidifaciens TaxID=85831 RepID=UPI0025582BD9|nr:hypothetical protein [Bacteroides acidifaciens]